MGIVVWKNGLFYYKSIQDWQSYDLQNLGLKIHNFSLELKQSKTPPAASYWIISTLVRRYLFFNPRCCKSWDCPSPMKKSYYNLFSSFTNHVITNHFSKLSSFLVPQIVRNGNIELTDRIDFTMILCYSVTNLLFWHFCRKAEPETRL